MTILSTVGWGDYELLDSGNSKRLERFGQYILSRPDPQAIWKPGLAESGWQKADAVFENDTWIFKKDMPKQWKISYKNLSFWARPTPFKHTGIFPEQHLQWDWITEQIKRHSGESKTTPESVQRDDSDFHQNDKGKKHHVLNLFGYTGIASLAAASAGALVTHVDASKPAITWTRENQELSDLSDKPIRWIVEDALSFIKREIRRGNTYDGIIMDPPVYGHGPNGEKWDFNKHFAMLLDACSQILSKNPLFVLVNAYALSSSSLMLYNMMQDYFGRVKGTIEYGELALQEKNRKRLLSTGIYCRLQASR